MSYYLFLADRHGTGSGSRWIIMGFAVKLAQSVSNRNLSFFSFVYLESTGNLPLTILGILDWITYVVLNFILSIYIVTEVFYFLDRDSTRWRIEETETQTRRETFWELYTYDSWQVSVSESIISYMYSDFFD